MKIMTWNIWGGKNLEEVKKFLQEQNPDIIGLQEVKTLNGINHAEYLAQELGYHVSYCKSFTTDRHTPVYDLGNAILTKDKPLSSVCHELSTLEDYQGSSVTEPRTAVEVTLPYHNSTLTVFSTHLGYSEKFGESDLRDRQTEKLVQLIRTHENVVLMGDFNSVPTSRVIATFSSLLRNTDGNLQQTSFTDLKDPDKTKYRIDYVFTSQNMPSRNFIIHSSEASDHLPLSIEI